VTAIEKAKAGLQDTDIGFATAHDGLPSVQPRNVIVDLLFPGQVEEILFENFRRSTDVLADFVGQEALFIDRPFKGCDHWNSEITEQPSKIR
jgi:hypothetical protein